ncbi:hypothetical protein OH809_11375 [Streptomyces sp. NBC_00873]|uniref:SCO2400 family protein n=1 Tax=unclassified Streptomyces TaxID=2593676 RepID=UPI0038644C38|nr:hypothetical protein OH809_11375 [Streptomyces sp. NBC_00873]WTA46752.1 hypothetical protein OH821_32430 [Streptomyces sp. NBC_00842]
MDYCSSCRRHLNGALVCPGCGAYAPDIAPPSADGRGGPARGAASGMTGAAPGAMYAGESAVSDRWHDAPLRDEAELGVGTNAAPYAGPSADVEGVPPARQGRAARRRQLARWKKNQRRAVVATAVALVGGGLTVATMDRHSTDQAQAATAPDDRSMGAAEEPVPEHTRPAATPPTTHRSSDTAPEAQSPATSAPRQQPFAAPPRRTPQIARPDATVPPRPAATTAPQPQNTAPSSSATAPDLTGTAKEQPSAPAAAGGTDSGSSQAGHAPASTSPTEVCLLVVCLG